jgi:hypothetical protein
MSDAKRIESAIRLGIISMFIATSFVCGALGSRYYQGGALLLASGHAVLLSWSARP